MRARYGWILSWMSFKPYTSLPPGDLVKLSTLFGALYYILAWRVCVHQPVNVAADAPKVLYIVCDDI